MQRFTAWLQESSLRDQLKYPQNPKHHPEGSVDRHTFMVHSALKHAIAMLQQKQADDPDGPFSELSLDFTQEDINLLRIAGMLHDIGKSTTTDPVKLTAHGHESPDAFEPAMQKLGPVWQKIYQNSNPEDKSDLWYIITYHMGLSDSAGFQSKSLRRELVDSRGKYRNDRRCRLLLVILLMDRLGRGGSSEYNRTQARDFVASNRSPGISGISGMYASSDAAKKQAEKEQLHINLPTTDSPQDFVNALKAKSLPRHVIANALRGKRPDLSPEQINTYLGENRVLFFRSFLETQEKEPIGM